MKAPIFIVGAPRSGTTILYKMLTEHPNVAWLSTLVSRYPEKLYLNRLFLLSLRWPILNNTLRKEISPAEGYPFWNTLFPGFSRPCRDLLAQDVSAKTKQAFRTAVSDCLVGNRDQFLAKITGWPRIAFLQEIFHDVKFIHVMRDGRAVANSLLNTGFWWGWQGPHKWRLGLLPAEYQDMWEKHDKSFVALAGIQWIILEESFERAKGKTKQGTVMEIKYEDLCSNPMGLTEEIADFCRIHWSRKFRSRLGEYSLRNANDKWKKELSNDQQRILQHILSNHLIRYGYQSSCAP